PAYNLVKQSLHTAKPERLVCREKEVGEITEFLEGNLEKKSAGSLYISGAPGTGKTAALLHIIDDVKESYPCKICYLNCMMVKDSATVFKKLYQEITGKALTGKRDPTRSMEKCLTTSKSSIILVLDEIDQLDSKSQEVLYTIFEWPTLPNSKLILIGIANALDLTDRILPRLQAQPKCKPQLLNFAPYSREQIATVIQDRLKKESYPCKICYLNCMMVKDSATVFKKLYQEITGKALTGKRDPTRSMEKCLTTSKSSIILVLDEIDQLDSKSQEVLYTIFEWPTLPNSKLILIGIANALDLTDRILPRLQAQPKCKPQLLNFAPYSREQIATVIQDRLKKLEDSGMCVMEASAIQFCARKVSAVAGDMRKALDVCRRSVELVEAEIRGQQILKAK
ncbi:hypothetical protein LOTGIDRAFT_176503, partial [Lottia gigantea]